MKYNNAKKVFCPAYRSWFSVVEAGISAGCLTAEAGDSEAGYWIKTTRHWRVLFGTQRCWVEFPRQASILHRMPCGRASITLNEKVFCRA
jgi:hypothetical protein